MSNNNAVGTPESPLILPDYQSEENWEAFIHLFPNEQRAMAPMYAEAAKSLDDTEAELIRQGVTTQRMKVDAAEWESWVEANNQPRIRETVGHFAMQKYVDHLNQARKSNE